MENYKLIDGYEHYMISDQGNVFSCRNNKVMMPGRNTCGYRYVRLPNNKIYSNKLVHVLVAKHFLESVEDKKEVNHIDGNKNNNSLENLQYVNRTENARHAFHSLGKDNLGCGSIKIKSLDFGFATPSINQMGRHLHYMGLLKNPTSLIVSANRMKNIGLKKFRHRGMRFQLLID